MLIEEHIKSIIDEDDKQISSEEFKQDESAFARSSMAGRISEFRNSCVDPNIFQ